MADPIRLSGVSELVLEVLDLERALGFYRNVLGLALIRQSEDRAWLMAGERTRIGLWAPQVGLAGGRGGVHVHYAFHIEGAAFEAAIDLIRSHGHAVEVIDFSDEERGRAGYVTDPDGNVVELWTFDVRYELEESA